MLKPAIGILGGTFDPIHDGHLRTALEVAMALNLSEVRLIPCGVPPHRQPPQASGEHRLAMAALAALPEPLLTVDDRELCLSGPSYTINTLKSLRTELPKTPLCLILGMDAFAHLNLWYQWEMLLTFAHIVIVDRGPMPAALHPDLQKLHNACCTLDPNLLKQRCYGSIFHQNITLLAISATQLRKDIARNCNPRFLLPNTVWTYIEAHGLYQPSKEDTHAH